MYESANRYDDGLGGGGGGGGGSTGGVGTSVVTKPSQVSRPRTVRPTEEEAKNILFALDAANISAASILSRMDNNHEILQDCIREVRSAHDIVSASNATMPIGVGV